MSRIKLFLRPLPAAALLAITACATTAPSVQTTDTIVSPAATTMNFSETKAIADRADPLARARIWADIYNTDPTQLEPAIEFATALRTIGSHDRAAEITSRTAIIHPDSYALMMVYGRALTSEQSLPRAADVFIQAIQIDPDRADAYAALGLVYDKGERHDFAQQAYVRAIEIDPNRPATMSNYGLSLALSGNISLAEDILRQAILLPGADQRVEQNLALVLGLQGKFDEMTNVSGSAPEGIMIHNADILRQMLGTSGMSSGSLDMMSFEETEKPTPAPVIPVTEEVITSVPPSPEVIPGSDDEIIETARTELPRLRGSLSE